MVLKYSLRGAGLWAALMLNSAGFAAVDPFPEANSTATPHYGAWGFDLAGRDLAVPPGVDFYSYANGAWDQRQPIPADRSSYGNFDKLAVLSDNRVRQLITEAAAQPDDPASAKINAAYRSFMDEAAVEKLDAAPLQAELDAIRSEHSLTDVAAQMGRAAATFQSALFEAGIGTDLKAPTRYAVYVAFGGLGLPDRDYYLEAALAPKKALYQKYVAQMLSLAGWADPEENAQKVVEWETRIATVSWTRTQKRDRDKNYNPMTVAALAALAPGFDFGAMLRAANLGDTRRVIVTTNTAFPLAAQIFAATRLSTLQAWQAFHLVDSAAPYLSARFVNARFEFRNRALAGQPEIRPRWKRGVAFVDGTIGEAIGQKYVAEYFPAEAKAKIDALVRELIAALHQRIARLEWMSPETKAKARLKLNKLTVKIGYPEKWRNYDALALKPGDLYGNAARSTSFEWNYEVARLNQPVDKLEWALTPQTVNAYYMPSNNEIVFPAAILQPPFFDPNADPAINYGGIGSIIGHEMTHGFDDQGRKSDGDGALRDWWTAEDAAQFKARAERLGVQYDRFEVLKGYFINGQLTMGENIADLGGLLLALDAYHASLRGKPAPVLDGLTGDQRVFLGFAQNWRRKMRDDAAIQLSKSDPHSADRFRANGPVRNVPAWYDAFQIKPEDPLYLAPENRVHLW